MSVSRTGPAARVRPLLALVALPALLLSALPVCAQDGASPDSPRVRLWSFEAVSGPSFGGPADDLEAAMRLAGFDDSMSGGWFGGGTTTYPQTYDDETDRFSYWGAVRRRLGHGPWHVGIGGGPTDFGSVEGYRERVDGLYASVFVSADCRILTLAPMAWFQPVPALRLGAGPALHRVDLELGQTYGSGTVQSREWKPGFVVEAALTVPVDTPVFFAALAQYRWVGTATSGSWEATTYKGAHVEFPATNVSVSHAFVAIGIGGRF